MKKICFVTGSRADYGILAPIMKEVARSPMAEVQIVATNMHLSPRHGMTVNEIEADGFQVDEKIDSLVEGGDAHATALSMAKVQSALSEAFERLKPDLVVILGDRYEALAAASVAVVYNIPIAHMHGGETTEGAIDDKFRHAITQLSDLHFASTPQYAQRIIDMGKKPENVFHSGAPGAEGVDILNPQIALKFFETTGIREGEPFILLAFHPVTTLENKGADELESTLEALDLLLNQGYKVLITMPNSDPGNQKIAEILEQWASMHSSRVVTVKSLGSQLFHYALETASVIVGNSSAALIEAPSYRLPAVNVGIRQKGRIHGITVIDSPGNKQRIYDALQAALSIEMKAVIMGLEVSALNPYFKEDATSFIVDKLITY